MKKDARLHEPTSRRQFTRAIVAAAIAAPMIACKSDGGVAVKTATTLPTPTPTPTGPAKENCFPSSGGPLDHIPPMGFDGGGGSVVIDTRNRFDTGDTRPPFRYFEHPSITDDRDKLGDLGEVRVITELIDYPYLTDVRYSNFPDDCKLLLWYQKVAAAPAPPEGPRPGPFDCIYMPDDFTRDPDVTIVGGRQAASSRRFLMTIKNKLRPEEKSHKCRGSIRYRDADDGSSRGHFRIGQWRVVRSDGGTVTDTAGDPFEDHTNRVPPTPRPEHFRLYVTFKHFQPHREKTE